MIFTVAVDGPAASGKGTISRQISKYFGFSYLDTGLIYRYIGSKVLRGISPFQALSEMDYGSMNSELLRAEAVSIAASKIAADPKVREALVFYQKSFAKKKGGAVLDGRDIGTVISPDADIKFFVTASEKVRAERRFKELFLVDKELTFEDLLGKIKKRDRADEERSISPLVRAEDAVLLDTTELSIDTSVDIAINAISRVLKSKA